MILRIHFSVVFSIALLASVAAGLVIPLDKRQSRALYVREGLTEDGVNSLIFKRVRGVAQMDKQSAWYRSSKAITKFKENASKAIHDAVSAAYRNTKNLPHVLTTYHIPGSSETGRRDHHYTGQDIHDAVLESHWEAARIDHPSRPDMPEDEREKERQKLARKSPLKAFLNENHRVPKADGTGGGSPLPHLPQMDPDQGLKEWPLVNKHDPAASSPARVMIQKVGKHHVFHGLIAHDQSRKQGDRGEMDHFQVHGSKPSWRSRLAHRFQKMKSHLSKKVHSLWKKVHRKSRKA